MKTVPYYLGLCNFVICVATYSIFFGTVYFFECNFSGASGAVTCKDAGVFEGFIEYTHTISMLSMMIRMFTAFILDFWALYFLITLTDGIKTNEKKEELQDVQ